MTPQELKQKELKLIETLAIKLRLYPGSVNDVIEELKNIWELAYLAGINEGIKKALETIKK